MFQLRPAALAACLLWSGPALADGWKVAGLAIGERNRAVTYVEAESIREKGGKLRFRSEQYLERDNKGFNRISALSEVDCRSMTVTVLRESYYDDAALVAFGPTPRESSHYSTASSYHWVLRRICGGDYLSASIDDHRDDAARMFTLDWSPVPGRLAVAMPIVAPGRSSSSQVAAMGAGTAGAAVSGR